jgi:hypothetical protein
MVQPFRTTGLMKASIFCTNICPDGYIVVRICRILNCYHVNHTGRTTVSGEEEIGEFVPGQGFRDRDLFTSCFPDYQEQVIDLLVAFDFRFIEDNLPGDTDTLLLEG